MTTNGAEGVTVLWQESAPRGRRSKINIVLLKLYKQIRQVDSPEDV